MPKNKREELGYLLDVLFKEAKEEILENVMNENHKLKWTKPEDIKEGENTDTKKTTTFDKLRDSFFGILYISQLTELAKGPVDSKWHGDFVSKEGDKMKENDGFRITMTINGLPFDPEVFFDRLKLGYEALVAKESTRVVTDLIGNRLNDLVDSLDSFKREFEDLVHQRLNNMRPIE